MPLHQQRLQRLPESFPQLPKLLRLPQKDFRILVLKRILEALLFEYDGFEEGDKRCELEVRNFLHLGLHSVRLEAVRKIKDSARMAAIHDTGKCDPLLHGSDEGCVELIIADLTIGLVVEGDQGLIISILYGGRGGSKGTQYKLGDWLEQKGRTWSAPAVRK